MWSFDPRSNPRDRSRPARNPRYAPESLERRLSPGGIGPMTMPPAQVCAGELPLPPPPPLLPPSPPADPPGPSGPA